MTVEERTVAVRALLDAGTTRLPVHLREVAACYGVALFTYSQYAQATETTVAQVAKRFGADGFSQSYFGKPAVFYRECGNLGRLRWTVAHELGHLLLGHLDGRAPDGDEADRQADALAAELLCPSGVVAACGSVGQATLARMCDISVAAAGCRLRDIARGRGAESPEEQELAVRFVGFITERKSRINHGCDEELPRPRSMRI